MSLERIEKRGRDKQVRTGLRRLSRVRQSFGGRTRRCVHPFLKSSEGCGWVDSQKVFLEEPRGGRFFVSGLHQLVTKNTYEIQCDIYRQRLREMECCTRKEREK